MKEVKHTPGKRQKRKSMNCSVKIGINLQNDKSEMQPLKYVMHRNSGFSGQLRRKCKKYFFNK